MGHHTLIPIARTRHHRSERLSDHEIYDDLVKRLFKNVLHKADLNEVVFARRGKADRSDALHEAIRRAKINFEKKWSVSSNTPTRIRSAYPHECAGLQIIDYYLWALQRLLERGEDRFFECLAPGFRLIMDLDDNRSKGYGEWYRDKNPLSIEKMKPLVG